MPEPSNADQWQRLLADLKDRLKESGCWSPVARSERFIPAGNLEGPVYMEVGYVYGEVRVRYFIDRLTVGHTDFHHPLDLLPGSQQMREVEDFVNAHIKTEGNLP